MWKLMGPVCGSAAARAVLGSLQGKAVQPAFIGGWEEVVAGICCKLNNASAFWETAPGMIPSLSLLDGC